MTTMNPVHPSTYSVVRFSAALVAALTGMSLNVRAADPVNYTLNTNNGNWSAAGTWSPSGVPTAADSIVGTAASNTVYVTDSRVVNNFTLSSGSNTLAVVGQSSSGALTINGALTKSGGGQLSFWTDGSGNTLSLSIGSVSLSSGTLFLGSGSALSRNLAALSVAGNVSVGTGTLLNLFVGTGSTTATFGGEFAVDGTVNLRHATVSGAANTAGSLTVGSLTGTTGNIQVTSSTFAATAKLTIQSTADATFGGTLVNGGTAAVLSLVKSGSFTQTLSGSLNTYTGGTTITAGTLLVTNTSGSSATGTGAVAVSGGTLGGTGFISGTTTVTGGNLAAGTQGTAGTLTFTGTLDIAGLTGTGQLKFDLGAVNASDKIVANTFSFGSSVLNFDDFSFTSLSGFGAGTYTLFDSATSIAASSLGTSLTGTIDGLAAELSVSGDDLILTVVAIPEPSTYAAIGGALVLGLAIYRRRK